ncbi:MAG: hypothetical protein J6M60_07235 [Clostridia bacterium]|nr:hypothetical protein [Clostridia bacterium]
MKKEITTNEKKSKIIYNKDGTFSRVKINKNIFSNKNESIQKNVNKIIKKYIGEYAYIIESGQKIYFDKNLVGEYTYSNTTKNLPVSYKLAKGRAAIIFKEIINNAKGRIWEPNKKEKHKIDAYYGFYRYVTRFSFEYNGFEQIYEGTILIRNDKNGKKYLYDVLNIKK